jgi:hypothetical protein
LKEEAKVNELIMFISPCGGRLNYLHFNFAGIDHKAEFWRLGV